MKIPMKIMTGAAAAMAMAIVIASAAQAENWQWQPRISLGYQYDDNYRLELPGLEIEVSGAVLDAQLRLLSEGQLTTWSLTPRVRANHFPDEPEEESRDYYGLYEFEHRGQRMQTNVRARYSDESVVRSEAPEEIPGTEIDPDLGQGGGADAGRLSVRNRRAMLEFSPSMRYTLSQRRGFELGGHYLDVDFDETEIEQISYVDYGVVGGFSFNQSPRTTLTLRALASRYDPETDANDAEAFGAQAEWSTESTQTTRTFLRVGVQRTRIDQQTPLGIEPDTHTNYIAGVGGRWTGQRNEALLDLTHNIGPTSSGFVVERDQLRLRWTRHLTERADLLIGVRGTRDAAIEEDANYATRTYANGNIGLEWRLMRQFAMAASYDYTWQEFDDEPSDRKSQGVMLSFIYEPHPDEPSR